MSLLSRVLVTLRDHCRVGPEDRIAVALSGGADSVALVWILRQLERDGTLGASLSGLLHVNHGLRGAESARDEAFCVALAGRLQLPIEVAHVDVAALARESGRSLEATGRDVRYRFFREAAARVGATVIATAHTVDDQAETVLLRLLRGAGARGVGGIRVRRGAIVRPLLHVRRAELRAHLAGIDETFCEDASNLDVSVPRNRVRHELLPLIGRLAPGGASALARFAELNAADEAYLLGVATEAAAGIVLSNSSNGACGPREESESASAAARALGGGAPSAQLFDGAFPRGGVQLSAEALAALPPAIGRRVVRLLMEQVAPGLGFSLRHIQAVVALASASDADGGLDLAHLRVERSGARLWLGLRVREAVSAFDYRLPLPGWLEVPEAGMTIAASIQETLGSLALASGRGDVATVQGTGGGPWVVRSRRPGDRLQPLGAPGHRKLHDVLIDRKVPRDVRDRVPVVVDEAGRIVWVVGVTIAHECRVTTPQTGVVVLKVLRDAG